MLTKHYYKFLKYKDGKIVSAHGDQEWEIGKEYSVSGKVKAYNNGFHASETIVQALSYVHGSVLAVVTASGDSDNDSDKVCYRSMTIKRAYHWRLEDSIALAVYAAEQVIGMYECKYPNDPRPRDAIKAAKAYLRCMHNGGNVNTAAIAADNAAYDATNAAYAADAANAAGNTIDYTKYAATAAAISASSSAGAAASIYAAATRAYADTDAYAANNAANNAVEAVGCAEDAASYAARAAERAGVTSNINRWCLSRIKKLERI